VVFPNDPVLCMNHERLIPGGQTRTHSPSDQQIGRTAQAIPHVLAQAGYGALLQVVDESRTA
jgi:hypothetical protein